MVASEQVINMFRTVTEKLGTVDILVNNAGIQRDAGFIDMSLEQWNLVLGVNLTGQFLFVDGGMMLYPGFVGNG